MTIPNSKSLYKISIIFFLILIISGLISAFIRLISIEAILIFIVIIVITIRSKNIKWIKKLIYKSLEVGSYYKHRKSPPNNPKVAAKESLKSISYLISKIQNDVSYKALKIQKKRIEDELLRGDFIIAIFGPGSTGKTSLVRSLLKEVVGNVSPLIGATDSSTIYRMRLKGIERVIQIIDTPGLFESGDIGKLRKKDSLYRATKADLIIVVIDNDLRALEMDLIISLSEGGKRMLIVLNKCDLRGEKEVNQLISIIRTKTQGYVKPEDVIEATSSPQSIPRPGSAPFQPYPEIDRLIRRIAKVLHEEGEELIADNILIQCRNLGLSGRRLLNKQRKDKAVKCIDRYSWISSGVIMITPLPGIDFLGTAAVNAQMVVDIANIYGVDINMSRAKELALSVAKTLAGLGIVKSGLSFISNALSINLPTLLVGKFFQAISTAWLTKVAGESFITFFSQDQDWGDGGIQEVVQHHFKLNSRDSSLKRFIEIALEKVVEPQNIREKIQLPPHQKLQEEEEE